MPFRTTQLEKKTCCSVLQCQRSLLGNTAPIGQKHNCCSVLQCVAVSKVILGQRGPNWLNVLQYVAMCCGVAGHSRATTGTICCILLQRVAVSKEISGSHGPNWQKIIACVKSHSWATLKSHSWAESFVADSATPGKNLLHLVASCCSVTSHFRVTRSRLAKNVACVNSHYRATRPHLAKILTSRFYGDFTWNV